MSQPPTTSAPRSDEPDPRNSLRHVLQADPVKQEMPDAPTPIKSEAGQLAANENDHEPDQDPDQDNIDDPTKPKGPDEQPMYTSTTTTTRRNANGSVSSVYSGNKIRHLKKEDGVPLWRKDIQYDFLRYVFDDSTRVFHKVSDGTPDHTFADIYLDAMAKSSKCSKILKDKLLTERAAAINMAMVCLLVNVGRMNTTLNFFPEMRAQLRTYHSIPSLQAHQDPNAYKQLQDAPRLKSILKGATEDTQQPSTIEEIKATSVPRTNPVNLIFVLAQYAPKISELHFFPPRDFFDLVMRSALSSESRAKAFLWLMWWYLESDFTEHDAQNNPFGPGQPGTAGDATSGMAIKTPPFKHLTEEEAALENVDTEEEKNFGEEKRKERIAILATDMAPVVTGPKRGIKKGFTNNPVFSVASDDGSMTPGRDHQSPAPGSFRSSGRAKAPLKALQADYGSDTDRTRSASPPSVAGYAPRMTPNMRINNLLNDDSPATPPAPLPTKGPGRGNWGPRSKGTPSTAGGGGAGGSARHPYKAHLDVAAAPSPSSSSMHVGGGVNGPHGFYLPLNGADPSVNRKRPPTAHQMAVEQHRKKQVDYILDRKLRTRHREAERRRARESTFGRAWKRLKFMPDGYDSEEEFYAAAALAAEGNGNGNGNGNGSGGANGPGLVEHSPVRNPGAAAGRPLLEATRLAGLTPIVDRLELDDYGEEMTHWARVFRQTGRRLDRWDGNGGDDDDADVSGVPGRKRRERERDGGAMAAAAAVGATPHHADLVWVGEDSVATPGSAGPAAVKGSASRRGGASARRNNRKSGLDAAAARPTSSAAGDVSEQGDDEHLKSAFAKLKAVREGRRPLFAEALDDGTGPEDEDEEEEDDEDMEEEGGDDESDEDEDMGGA